MCVCMKLLMYIMYIYIQLHVYMDIYIYIHTVYHPDSNLIMLNFLTLFISLFS